MGPAQHAREEPEVGRRIRLRMKSSSLYLPSRRNTWIRFRLRSDMYTNLLFEDADTVHAEEILRRRRALGGHLRRVGTPPLSVCEEMQVGRRFPGCTPVPL